MLVCLTCSWQVLYVADSKEYVSTWHLPTGTRTNSFQTPTGGRVTTLLSLNNFSPGTLLVGTDDGVVCVWKNAHQNEQLQVNKNYN